MRTVWHCDGSIAALPWCFKSINFGSSRVKFWYIEKLCDGSIQILIDPWNHNFISRVSKKAQKYGKYMFLDKLHRVAAVSSVAMREVIECLGQIQAGHTWRVVHEIDIKNLPRWGTAMRMRIWRDKCKFITEETHEVLKNINSNKNDISLFVNQIEPQLALYL